MITTGSGSEIYICEDLPATYDKAGYNALIWTKIEKTMGGLEYGKEFEMVDFVGLGDRQIVQLKGNYRCGSANLQFASLPADAGQVLVLEASESDNNYSFKVVRTDGVVDAFTAKVTTFKPNIQSGAILSVSAPIAIQTNIINIA